MSLTIELPPADETRLRVRAEAAGKSVTEVTVQLVRASLWRPPAESMAPVSEEFTADEMTEAELDAFIDQVRQEIWDERTVRPRRMVQRADPA